MKNRYTAYIEMTIAAILWSIAGIFIKLIDLNPFTIAGFRSLCATIPVIVIILFTKEKIKVNKNTVRAAISLMLTFCCFVTANKLTTAANAIVLQFTAPIFILLINHFFLHIEIKKFDIITVILTFLGIAFFFFDSIEGGNIIGNIIAILAGLCMGTMYIFVNKSNPDEKMSSILLGHLLTAVIASSIGFILPNFKNFLPEALTVGFNLDAKGLICILILGIFQLGIPYVLVGIASKNCSPLASSLISVFEPLLNPVWVAIFDGEVPGLFAYFGAFIIIVTISAWCVISAKDEKKIGEAL